MRKPSWLMQLPIVFGALALALLLSVELLMPKSWREGLREVAFDYVLAIDHGLRPRTATESGSRVVVVDIDRRSLEAVGPWPWPRATVAKLIEAIAVAKPAVRAIDILFADQNQRSHATPARRFDASTSHAESNAAGNAATAGDQQLAQAGRETAVVFGFVLDTDGQGRVPQVPVITRNTPRFDGLWSTAGAAAPPSLLAERASGLGALSLPASRDGVVRYVPALVGVGGSVLPGLAIETIRVAHGASAYVLQGNPLILTTGDVQVP